ncbi:SDR family oxidoreductase [Paucilactobacillus hokkaidonensis]|uniref:SDR family oxidoreductase n=1 Tax=Paucilactobacillus hokkaidonensis TaxID=1193095 RepID=UPI0006D1BD0B|nr:NAD(P)H-binding protein [Paucilactobacillus hokkaidonensis]
MKITLLGSVGNINRYVIPALVSAGHTVTVVTHSDKRTAAIKQLGAIPAVGSMTDESFLTDQFTGADVIYLMLSGGTNNDALQAAKDQGKIFFITRLKLLESKISSISVVSVLIHHMMRLVYYLTTTSLRQHYSN